MSRRVANAFYFVLALLLWPLYVATHRNYRSGRR